MNLPPNILTFTLVGTDEPVYIDKSTVAAVCSHNERISTIYLRYSDVGFTVRANAEQIMGLIYDES